MITQSTPFEPNKKVKKNGNLERRQEILSAAIDLFSQKGFSRTPTSLIARKAGVAEGLLFHYFKNKKGILFNILIDVIEEYVSGIEAIEQTSLSGLEFIERLVLFHFELRETRSEAFRVLNRELGSDIIETNSEEFEILTEKWDTILEAIQNALTKGQKDGTIRDVPINETALVIRGTLMGVSSLYREMLPVLNLKAIPGEVVNFVRRSLSPNATNLSGEVK